MGMSSCKKKGRGLQAPMVWILSTTSNWKHLGVIVHFLTSLTFVTLTT